MGCKCLDDVRSNIDRIDDEIVKLIAERTGYVKQAAKFKKSGNDVKAPARVEAVIEMVRGKAQKYGADPNMVEALYREMIGRFVDMEISEFSNKGVHK